MQFLEALGIGCFILSTEVSSTAETMEFFEEIFSRNYSNSIAAAALDAWSLLATTAPVSRIPALIQKYFFFLFLFFLHSLFFFFFF